MPVGVRLDRAAGRRATRLAQSTLFVLRVDPARAVGNFWIAVAGTLAGLIWFAAIQWQVRLRDQQA
jgi:hypothetical protein